MARRAAPPPADQVTHYEVWCDIAGQRRHRRADTEADVPALVNEVAADLRQAIKVDDSIAGDEAEAAAIEAAVNGIEVFKVTLTKEPAPIGTGG